MWDIFSKNFAFRGLTYNYLDNNIVKKYSKEEVQPLESLTNYELIKLCDNFLVSRIIEPRSPEL